MAKNIYKTAQGQMVDIDNLRLVNEDVIAVGNMGVNARGDRVSPNGEILETRNQIMKKRYNSSTTVITNPFTKPTTKLPDTVIEEAIVESPSEEESSSPALRGSLANSLTESLADYTVFDSASNNKTVDSTVLPKLKRI